MSSPVPCCRLRPEDSGARLFSGVFSSLTCALTFLQVRNRNDCRVCVCSVPLVTTGPAKGLPFGALAQNIDRWIEGKLEPYG